MRPVPNDILEEFTRVAEEAGLIVVRMPRRYHPSSLFYRSTLEALRPAIDLSPSKHNVSAHLGRQS